MKEKKRKDGNMNSYKVNLDTIRVFMFRLLDLRFTPDLKWNLYGTYKALLNSAMNIVARLGYPSLYGNWSLRMLKVDMP